MGDPSAIVPYSNSFDDEFSFSEDILMLDEIPSLNLDEYLPWTQPNFSSNHSISQSCDAIAKTDDLTFNPVVSGTLTSTTSNSQVRPSEFRCETSHLQGILHPDNSGFGNPAQLPVWPAPPIPNICSSCQVLREITHTEGLHVTRLEIHGRLGLMCHAVLENRVVSSDWTTQSQYYQMIDFSKQSIGDVKEYLVQYCEGRKQDGYTLQHNPLVTFYEALCVGLINGDDSLDTDDFFQPSSADSAGEYQVNQPEPVNKTLRPMRDEVTFPKISLAEQRERTGKLTLKDLTGYFHLPIEDASKEVRVCPTVMKKICRKFGLPRWPHRKIKSLEKKISRRRESLNGSDPEARASAQSDIESFQHELARIFAASNA